MSFRSQVRNLFSALGYYILPKYSFAHRCTPRIYGDVDHLFVGYYDHDPISSDGKSLLCHRIDPMYNGYIEPHIGEVGLLSLDDSSFSPITSVKALNWQLGSRVQWYDEKSCILNDVENGIHCSKIFDVQTGQLVDLQPWPFWAISPDKRFGASLNFQVLRQRRPGYGYRGYSPDQLHDVLRLFDLKTHNVHLEYDIFDLINAVGINYSISDTCYLNHICWNHQSTKFITVICWESAYLSKRMIYGVLVDIETGSLQLLNDSGFFSHHTWLKDGTLLAYVEVNGSKAYHVWHEEHGWHPLLNSFPLEDGHPTLDSDTGDVIVDTYPDLFSRTRLYSCSPSNNIKPELLLTLANHPSFRGPLRCDLHPRYSSLHRKVVCDISPLKSRQILVLDL